MASSNVTLAAMDAQEEDTAAISPTWMPKVYWIFVGSFTAFLMAVYVCEVATKVARLQAARNFKPLPAKPKILLSEAWMRLVVISRCVVNASLPANSIFRTLGIPSPSLGAVTLVVANAALLLTLGFYKLDPTNKEDYQHLAYRWGFLSAGQVPLLFALAGKNNLIGRLAGRGYERLNWLHRWTARTLLLTVTLHVGFWFGEWAPDIKCRVRASSHVQTGLAAWGVLAWSTFSGFGPVRRLGYEFFVLQHMASFTALIILLMVHVPSRARSWLWAAIAIFLFDRATRGFALMFANFSWLHAKRAEKTGLGLTSCAARLEPLPGPATRVTIDNPPMRWRPGQHAVLGFPLFAFTQTHPFNISTLMEDRKLEFVIKARGGMTRRLYDEAREQHRLLQKHPSTPLMPVSIEGPYGTLRELKQFDTVTLIAGDTGATYIIPLLRHLIESWKDRHAQPNHVTSSSRNTFGTVVRRIRLVWSVRRREQTASFAAALSDAVADATRLRQDGTDIGLDAAVHITRESLTGTSGSMTRYPATPGQGRTFKMSSDIDVEKRAALAGGVWGHSDGRLHPSIALIAGRPRLRNVILQTQEQARGETAVVCCGPRLMNEEARRHCVSVGLDGALSSKKGRANGIWFWAEGYEY